MVVPFEMFVKIEFSHERERALSTRIDRHWHTLLLCRLGICSQVLFTLVGLLVSLQACSLTKTPPALATAIWLLLGVDCALVSF